MAVWWAELCPPHRDNCGLVVLCFDGDAAERARDLSVGEGKDRSDTTVNIFGVPAFLNRCGMLVGTHGWNDVIRYCPFFPRCFFLR